MGVHGRLLGLCVGIGLVRWRLNTASTLGAILRSVGANFRAGCWGLDVAIVLSAVSRLGIYINKQGVSLWEPSGPPGTMAAPGSLTWGWRRGCWVLTRRRSLLLMSR